MIGPIDSTDNVFDWCQKQYEESGITELVDHAGFEPYLKDVAGYKIPYFTREGTWIPNYFRVRVHPKSQRSFVDDDGKYGEHLGISKYWQKPGLKQRIYWPPVVGVDHSANLADLGLPIFICEGEKKALKLQHELLTAGVKGSVLGVPGVRIGKEIITELQSIPWSATTRSGSHANRPVYLVFDFNDIGLGESDTRRGEDSLFSYFATSHADIMLLRWEAAPDAGVQKIDDWLVAGGDLKEALKNSTANKNLNGNELIRLMLGISDHWAQYKGVYVIIDGPNKGSSMAKTPFLDSNAHLKTVGLNGKGKPHKVFAAHEWIEWQGKRTMDGFCFLPPALGTTLQEWVGRTLNISHEWLPIKEPEEAPWDEAPPLPVHLIDRLLDNFGETPAHTLQLSRIIAHGLLKPWENTSQCVAIIDKGGTGKGLLANSIINLGQGKLAKMIELDRKDAFNGELMGVVFGFADELMRGGISGKDLEAINKRLVGNEWITVNEKHQPVKEVRNYLRLFYFVNTKYPFHIAADDRRMNVFCGKERIGPPTDDETSGNNFAQEYIAFMNSDVFAATWLAWAQAVDLKTYDPFALGPISTARRRAVGFSSTNEDDFMSGENMDYREVITYEQLKEAWSNFAPRNDKTTQKLVLMLEDRGWVVRKEPIKHQGKTTRVCVRRPELLGLSPKELSELAAKGPETKY